MSETPASSTAASSRGFWICTLAIVCASAAMLCIAAAKSELWLDEVWTIGLVQNLVHTPADIITQLKHDNNHFLNSLVVYLVGPNGSAWSYRWPAVAAGVATVVLAGWVQRRRGDATAITAMLLTAFSYLLVHYSHEARGYSYLLTFTLLAYGSLCEADARPRLRWEILFAVSCILGFLSQPLFLIFFLAAQVYAWCPPRDKTWAGNSLRFVFRTLLPGLFFAWLYWINLSRMDVGGGMHWDYFAVVVQTLSLAAGGPFSPPWSYLAAAVSALAGAVALWQIAHQSPRRAIYYLCVIVICPALLVIVTQRSDIYERYLLISVLFLLLLWSDGLGLLWASGKRGRFAVIVLLLAYLAANGRHITQLLVSGHGHYRDAIQWMDRQTQSSEILVHLDHPFRQGVMFEYYGERVDMAKPMFMITDEGKETPEWYLTHSTDPDFIPPETLDTKWGVYRLEKHYPFGGMSGWQLNLYRRQP